MAVDTIYLKNEQGVDVPYQIGADSRNVTYSPNAETVEGSVHKELQQNNIHKNTIIANNTGVHGLRYTDNKLQVQAPGGGQTPIDFGTGDMKKVDYDDPSQNGVIAIAHGGTGNTSGYVRIGAESGSTIGARATVEGINNIGSGDCSHAEGRENIAAGDYSHVGGQGNIITENGLRSIAHGEKNKVTNENSLVIGECIQVNGSNSLVVGSGKNSTPTLEQDCVNKISNPNGITAFNGLDGKFQNKIPTGHFSDQPITFSATTSRQYNSTIQGQDGTFGAFIELVGAETQKVLIAPYSMYLISVSGYYNTDASTPSNTVVAAAMYFCIGHCEIGGPGRVLRIEGETQDNIQRPTIILRAGGILEITGVENINMQVQLIRLA